MFLCKGGSVAFIAASADKDFLKTCDVIGRSDLAAGEKFRGNSARLKGAAELKAELESALSRKTASVGGFG